MPVGNGRMTPSAVAKGVVEQSPLPAAPPQSASVVHGPKRFVCALVWHSIGPATAERLYVPAMPCPSSTSGAHVAPAIVVVVVLPPEVVVVSVPVVVVVPMTVVVVSIPVVVVVAIAVVVVLPPAVVVVVVCMGVVVVDPIAVVVVLPMAVVVVEAGTVVVVLVGSVVVVVVVVGHDSDVARGRHTSVILSASTP